MAPSSGLSSPSLNEQLRRRSQRVRLALPITLSGKDRAGKEFQESTRTRVVNKHGARISTTHELAPGGVVKIENQALGLGAKATVINVGQRNSSGPLEVGVQLMRAENVWGVIFPPEDWEGETSQATRGAAVDGSPQSSPGATGEMAPPHPGTTGSVPPALSQQNPRPEEPQRPTVVPARAIAPVTQPEQVDEVTAAGLAAVSKHLDEVVEAQISDSTEKFIQFTNQFALRVQADLQEAANRTEDQMVGLMQQKLGTLADRVQASRTALENLLAKCQNLEKNATNLIEDAGRQLRQASRQALESALRELTVSLQKEIEGTSAIAEAESHERVRAAIAETVGATLVKADERLGALIEDRLVKANAALQVQQQQSMEGVQAQLNEIAVSGTTKLAARFETMAKEAARSARGDLEESVRQSVASMVARTTKSAQEQVQLLTQDALVSLQENAQGQQKRLQEESANLRQSSAQEISKTAEVFNKNIAQRAEMAIGSLQSAVEEGISRLRTARVESEGGMRAAAEEFQTQLAVRSASALQGCQTDLDKLIQERQERAAQAFQERLQITADKLAEASAQKVQRNIQDDADAMAAAFSKEANLRLSAVAEEFFGRSSADLHARLTAASETQVDAVIRSASERFSEQLKKAIQEAGVTLEKESWIELQRVAQALLQSSSETLRTELEQSAAKFQDDVKVIRLALASDARQHLLVLTQSTVATLNREAAAGLNEFRARLRKIEQEAQEEGLRELEVNFRESLEKQRATVASFLDQRGEQSRDLAALQIKTASEQIVAKAAEALEEQVGKSTRTLAEAGEQARVNLQNQGEKIDVKAQSSVWEYQRQVEQATNSSLEKFRKETATLLDDVVIRLQDSVRSFQRSAADEVRSELQKASDDLVEVSAAEMRRQTERALELITERLKEKEAEVVGDAANVFRKRIADIFAILQGDPQRTAELPGSDRVKNQN